MPRFASFAIAVVLGLALAWAALRPPSPSPANAPLDRFSAERAMADVRLLARAAHPTGSAEIACVRAAIVARFRQLGLEVSVRPGLGVDDQVKWAPGSVNAALAQNILAVLPGRDRTLPALLIMAHHDTVTNSPGAADDTAGVASALEVARALKATGPHARDAMFLITDAEEPGLLGSQAFFTSDPMSRRAGAVLNLETRGDSGRAAMFETGPGNAAMIDLYRRTIAHPDANSLTAAVYHKMPNGTDFTRAMARGLPGLNFAFIGDQLAYHTPLSTPAHLNQGSLQHLGEQVLQAGRRLADAPSLPKPTQDVVYSDAAGLFLIAYPVWAGWLLIALAAILVIGVAAAARRRELASDWEIARGAAGLLLIVTGSALALAVAGHLLGGAASYTRVYALVAHYSALLWGAVLLCLAVAVAAQGGMTAGASRWWAVGLAAVAAVLSLIGEFDAVAILLAVSVAVLGAFSLGRTTSGWGLWAGALIANLVLAILIQAVFPLGAFMLVWPLLIASATAALALVFNADDLGSPTALAVTGVGAVIVLALAGSWGEALFEAVGATAPVALAAVVLFAAPAVIPLADGWSAGQPGWSFSVALAAVAVALLVWTGLDAPSAARPALTEAFYLADFSAGPAAARFYRVDPLRTLDPWARAALSADATSPIGPSWSRCSKPRSGRRAPTPRRSRPLRSA